MIVPDWIYTVTYFPPLWWIGVIVAYRFVARRI